MKKRQKKKNGKKLIIVIVRDLNIKTSILPGEIITLYPNIILNEKTIKVRTESKHAR